MHSRPFSLPRDEKNLCVQARIVTLRESAQLQALTAPREMQRLVVLGEAFPPKALKLEFTGLAFGGPVAQPGFSRGD